MKRGAPEHPKTKRLMRALRVPSYAAIGLLESLFHFTAKYAPRGDVGRFSDEDIAEALGWDKDHSELIAALASSGWLDEHPEHRFVVHDWHEHADDSVKKTLKRWGKTLVGKVQTCPDYDRTSSINAEHVQTIPGQVQKTAEKIQTCPVRQKPEARSQSQSQKPETSSLRSDVDSPAASAKRGADNPEEGPPVLAFATTGTEKRWILRRDYLDFLEESFPDLDVLAECRKAKAYYDANGLKTAPGMKKALVNWLNRAVQYRRNGKGSNGSSLRPIEKRELCTTEKAMEEFRKSVPEITV